MKELHHDLCVNPSEGQKTDDTGVKFSRNWLKRRKNSISEEISCLSQKSRKTYWVIPVMTVLKEVRGSKPSSSLSKSLENLPEAKKILADYFDLWAVKFCLKKSRQNHLFCIKVTCMNAWGYRPVLTSLVDSLLAHLYNLVAIPDATTLAEAQYLLLLG